MRQRGRATNAARLWLPLALLVACNGPSDDVKLRDSSVAQLETLLVQAKSDDASQKREAVATARAVCDRATLDRAMTDKALERDVLGACARDLPQIEAFSGLHRQPH